MEAQGIRNVPDVPKRKIKLTLSRRYGLIFLLTVVFTFPFSTAPGLQGSLDRLQLEYVDIVFANRSDPNSPMEGKN